jgi:hypothetical protein
MREWRYNAMCSNLGNWSSSCISRLTAHKKPPEPVGMEAEYAPDYVYRKKIPLPTMIS